MSKERGRKNPESTFVKEQRVARKQARKDVKKIRPILKKDPDWLLASGEFEPTTHEDRKRRRRGLTRLTKKAVNLLFPEFKVSARHDTGTAYNWVIVEIEVPKTLETSQKSGIQERASMMLESVGISYSSYLTDYGLRTGDHYNSCLLIEVNGALS